MGAWGDVMQIKAVAITGRPSQWRLQAEDPLAENAAEALPIRWSYWMQSGFVQNRRYFPRVKLRAHATLGAGGKQWPVHILDLSFNGALAALIHKHDLTAGEHVTLHIESEDNSEIAIRMHGRLCHQRGHFLGIECRATGIDNQTQLRELLKRSQRQQSLAERSYSSLLADYDNDNG
jgi:hypothetical protein